jgi:hypothetical protein
MRVAIQEYKHSLYCTTMDTNSTKPAQTKVGLENMRCARLACIVMCRSAGCGWIGDGARGNKTVVQQSVWM